MLPHKNTHLKSYFCYFSWQKNMTEFCVSLHKESVLKKVYNNLNQCSITLKMVGPLGAPRGFFFNFNQLKIEKNGIQFPIYLGK